MELDPKPSVKMSSENVGMLNAELSQARRWCQKLTLSSRFLFSNTVCSETCLATFSLIVKDPVKKTCA